MKPELLLVIYIVIISAEFIFEKVLGILNYRKLDAVLPERVKGIYDPQKYKVSIHPIVDDFRLVRPYLKAGDRGCRLRR